MRQLNSEELLNKFDSYSRDITYSSFENLDAKLNQIFNFLHQQEIANRILERINEDFLELKSKIYITENLRNYKYYKEITNELNDRELQGAFAFFTIVEKFKVEKKYSNHYIELSNKWYKSSGNYRDWKDEFITNFWEPFTEIFEWYINESKTETENDFFSKEVQENLSEKLNEIQEIVSKLGFGQEIVFNEINDLRKLTKKLNKKNWNEIIKGKFIDLGLSGIISIETAKKVIEFLTGNEINLLN